MHTEGGSHLFFLVFFCLYGGFNLFAFLRFKHALDPNPMAMAALGGVMILMAEMIRRIPTPHGKYAITGNHEFYAGIEQALAFTTAAGFYRFAR